MATLTAVHPGKLSDKVSFRQRYGNYIGGKWVEPASGQYFENVTPVTGKILLRDSAFQRPGHREGAGRGACRARGLGTHQSDPSRDDHDPNCAADGGQPRSAGPGRDWDNGKPIRETTAADLPLAIDHWRYFAGCIRAQEGTISEIDHDTVAYHFHEPLGVVGQIIPWNFPILMATWKLAPAIAAGNCVVLKPAEQTPASILVWAELVGDLLPPGVLNIVNGFGLEAGKPLASSSRVAKIAFTGETTTGRLIMQYASQNLIPVTLELGGKSPNIFFADVLQEDDDFFDKAIEGFVMFALNQGEVCTCPSRALIQESIYDRFMERALKRVAAIKQANPLELDTMIGAQVSSEQMEKILSYIDIGKKEGAEVLAGGRARSPGRRPGRRLLCAADRFPRQQPHAHLPGGDLRAGGFRHHVQDRRRCAGDRQRHALRAGRGSVEPRRQPLLSAGARHPGRTRVDQLLSRLSGPRGIRRIQAVRHWPRDAQHDARPLSADQESAGELQPQEARLLLAAMGTPSRTSLFFPMGGTANPTGFCSGHSHCGQRSIMSELPPQVVATDLAIHLIRVLREKHGPLMFHQSGGCCDGSSPMCYPRGEFLVGDSDVQLGEVDGEPFYMSRSQFEYWKHTQLTLDVVPGRGGMFSLDGPEGLRFLIRSRVFDGDEIRDLRAGGAHLNSL